jgi:hypothetical protein
MRFSSARVLGVVGAGMLAGLAPTGFAGVSIPFTYQGELSTAGTPANGLYDMQFRFFDAPAGGAQQGSTLCVNNINVVNGLFTVQLDSGAIANGLPRYLQIDVRADVATPCTNVAGYTTLTPRTEITDAPRASFARSAQSSDFATSSGNATQLNGQPGSFYSNAGNLSAGTIPAARYGTTVVQTNTNNTITGINNFSNVGNTFFGNGSNLTGLWRTAGNAGTNAATNFVGTTDNVGFTIRANNVPAIRITPFSTDTHTIVMGSNSNSAGAFVGATIGGGGSEFPLDERNQVTGDFGTIAGGLGHTVASSGFVGGGFQNRTGSWSVATGGSGNWAFGQYSSVGGGINNRIQSPNLNPPPNSATIAGGNNNEVQGTSGAIGGGSQNIIEQASSFGTIVGGANNRVVGTYATVLGGTGNIAGGNGSVAMGLSARVRTPTDTGDADGDEGTLVFADATTGAFTSTGPNQFLIRASGGVGIGTNNPGLAPLRVVGSTSPTTWVESSATTGNAAAVLGVMTSTTPGSFSAGVRGVNNGTGGQGVGVYGSQAGNGFGVYGTATGSNAAGVYGSVNGATATGVYGGSGGINGYGVYGLASGANGWAGYFAGRATVTGAFSAASKAFRIDHPLDPANKELWHSCIESPDMMTMYNGNVVTDDAGYATIELPSYFEALNVDYKYQLTVIDSDPDSWTLAKVTQEIANNAFTIRTSNPNTKVSWQVSGVRNDAFAQKFRIVPEQDKSGEARGKLISPEAFGLPANPPPLLQ